MAVTDGTIGNSDLAMMRVSIEFLRATGDDLPAAKAMEIKLAELEDRDPEPWALE